MKYDSIIIGGGLAGLICGIVLAKAGQKTAIISAGQSALHFCSGSFELLGFAGGQEVTSPLDALDSLDKRHPYRSISRDRLVELLDEVPWLMAEAGLKVKGTYRRNHYRLTPLGYLKPAWLTLDDYVRIDDPDVMPWRKVAVVNLYGYIDFYPQFIAAGLSRHGVECRLGSFNLQQLDTLRHSTTEMRATNMARVLNDDALDEMAVKLNEHSKGCDAVIMPAVIGLFDDKPLERLRRQVNVPVYFVPTTPASVPGVRTQLQLRDYYERLGGTYLLGDRVFKTTMHDHHLHEIFTVNLGDMPLQADNFIIAAGSFFSYGIVATPQRVSEPVMGLDVNMHGGRPEWYDKDLYKSQPYMTFGVDTDDRLHAMLGGRPVDNLYAAGSILSGFNALKQGAGAGTTIITALRAAQEILNTL